MHGEDYDYDVDGEDYDYAKPTDKGIEVEIRFKEVRELLG